MKLALIGYGKMGKEIEQIAISRNHEIVLKIDLSNIDEFTHENLQKADVAIEFTSPESAVNNITTILNSKIPAVVGSTGWLKDYDKMKQVCIENDTALLVASNFSLGVNIFFKINKILAKIMNSQEDYNVGITEIHHTHKLDKPSGTAITTAQGIIENLDTKTEWTLERKTKENEIFIDAIREDEVPGTHTVKYESDIDVLEISHIAKNRKGFALGAVIAAEFLHHKKGVFTMNDVLNF
jgi:4-hydroxy-tetrahydrodipicolinate reductase